MILCTAIAAALAAASPGATVATGPVTCTAPIVVTGLAKVPAVTLDATGATLNAIIVRNSTGLHVTGGSLVGTAADFTSPTGYGFSVANSHDISLARADVSGFGRGAVIGTSSGFAIVRVHFHGLRSDGIDIGLSQHGTIDDNTFEDFRPVPAYTDAAGKWHDGDHPDGIQMWSRPAGIVADIEISHNDIVGGMQCMSAFNHLDPDATGKLVDDGGFDRLTWTANVCRTTMADGMVMSNGRASTVTGNDVSSLPGAKYKANLAIVLSTGTFCGNRALDVPKALGTAPCAAAAPQTNVKP